MIIITELRVHNVHNHSAPASKYSLLSPQRILTFHKFPSARNISQEVIFITLSQKWHSRILRLQRNFYEIPPVSSDPLTRQEMRDLTPMMGGEVYEVWSQGEGQPAQ